MSRQVNRDRHDSKHKDTSDDTKEPELNEEEEKKKRFIY
jgi:hypothetical protein